MKRNLYFNNIYNGASSEEKFNSVINYLDLFIQGESVCIFSHGITGMQWNYGFFMRH